MLVILQTRRNQGVKTVNKTILKKSWVFVIVFILALTLAACGNKKSVVPYGSLTDNAYVTADGFEVSEKELYEEMRLAGTNALLKMFQEIIYKEEIERVKADKESFKEDYLYHVNKTIFNISDIDQLKELPEAVVLKGVRSFVDAMDLLGVAITEADIDTIDFENHADVIFDTYTLDVAKRVYAREKLDEAVLDEDSTSYINVEKDIPAYFTSNVEKRYPLSFVSIRFSNQFESDATFRKHSIKAHVGQWYKIPDPRVDVVEGYALTILTNLGLEEKNGTGELTESEYESYYNDYKIDPARPALEGPDTALTIDETFNLVLVMYNEAYPYKEQIDATAFPTIDSFLADEKYVNLGEAQGLFTLTYEDFPVTRQNALESVRNYLYNTLSTEDGVRFTAQPRLFGNHYYVLFKLKDHNEEVEAQKNADGLFQVYEEDGKTLTEHAQTYFNKLKENKLTDAYVNQLSTQRLNDATVVIYDEDLHLTLRNDKFKFKKQSSSEFVAKVNDVEITVDDYYQKLDTQIGTSVAMDIAVSKALLASEYRSKITPKQMDEYRSNIENMIRQFSQDAFKNNGFPKEMGRAKFLKLAFQSDSIDEAIEKIYVKSEIEKLFLDDLEAHFGEEIYELFATYANRIREQFFSLTSSHILIYIDMNEDEDPDKPEAFFETLSEEDRVLYKTKITELMQLIHDKASAYSNISQGLKAIADEFAKSAKIKPDSCATPEGQLDPSCTWSEFKKLGLHVKFESLGANTNQTNYPDKDSKLDDKFFERIIDIYDYVKTEFYDFDKKFPSNHLDTKPSAYDNLLETDFGWHLILATDGAVANSAKFTAEDDRKYNQDDEYMIYEHIVLKDKDGNDLPGISAYSDTDAITANQIKIFLYQSKTEEGTVTLPSKVKTALNSYLTPVINKYENNHTKLFILNKFLMANNFQFASADNQERYKNILKINENQFFLYSETHEMFMEIYGDWFDTFK